MDWSKAKTLIIGMLIVVNVFLLGVCFIAQQNKAKGLETVTEDTVAYLADQGIRIDPTLIPTDTNGRSTLLVERDMTTEGLRAETLIGGSEVSRTGGIVRFSSADGSSSALWRGGGLFEASVRISGVSSYSGEPSTHPAILRLGEVGFTSALLSETSGDGDALQQLTLTQTQDGYPIFNAVLTVTCGADDTVYTAGRWCVGTAQPISAAKEAEIHGLLIRFAQQASSLGLTVREITSLRPGYVAQNMASSGIRLIPAWEVASGDTVRYISAIDGTLLVSE